MRSIKDEFFDMEGQVAIVTGASSGLGVTMAETLAQCGVNLVLVARRYNRLTELAVSLERREKVEVIPFQADVTSEEQMVKAVETAVSRLGTLEILVNNAGTSALSSSVDMKLEDWRRVVDVNLTAVFSCARIAAREMMKKKYGRIVNIASIYGVCGDIFQAAPYYATKGAVVNLTRALAVEWAQHGINVNAIGPGFFPSEMTEEAFKDETVVNHIKSRTPMGRIGEPRELGSALLFLVSPLSSYVTGQTVFVDGGWTAT